MTKIVFITAALASIIIGGILAYKEKDGWGWFLFVGLLILSGIAV